MKLAFIILCHESAEAISELAETLSHQGDTVCIHFDAGSSETEFAKLKERLSANPDVLFADRVKCGWGDYSLVEATLNALRRLRASGKDFDYACLLSGADVPLKPFSELKAFLTKNRSEGAEYIQSNPLRSGKWVVAGLERERFEYRHFFNERRHPLLFNKSYALQHRLKLKRRIPKALDPSLGAQWWCLTWETCLAILAYIESNPGIDRFFRLTWIPDESYFQTLVRLVVAPERIRNHSLTHYQFNDYGKPVVYFNEHYDLLVRQNFFFGRKVAPSAAGLRARLHALARSAGPTGLDLGKVGETSDDFATQREMRREESTLHRSPGRHYEPRAAEIPFLPQQLVVILELAQGVHRKAASAAAGAGELVHGELFDARRIEFAGGRDLFAGYRDWDVDARNAQPMAFLANVMAAGPAISVCYVGLGPQFETPVRLVQSLIQFSNVTVIAAAGASLLEAAVLEVQHRLGGAPPERPARDIDIMACISEAVSRRQRLATALKTLSALGPIWVAGDIDVPDDAAVLPKALPEPLRRVIEQAVAFERQDRAMAAAHPARGRVAALIAQTGAPHLWRPAGLPDVAAADGAQSSRSARQLIAIRRAPPATVPDDAP